MIYIFILSLFSGVLQAQEAPKTKPLPLKFSKKGGFYSNPIAVELVSVEGAKIYYTTDGSAPSTKKK
ncbi:MAG: chitobiase/beta-hexosaminidase C-terminal domain-containing protein, partial [Bacteroidota bacterium]